MKGARTRAVWRWLTLILLVNLIIGVINHTTDGGCWKTSCTWARGGSLEARPWGAEVQLVQPAGRTGLWQRLRGLAWMIVEGKWANNSSGRHGNGSMNTPVRPNFFEVGVASVSHGSNNRLTQIDWIINAYTLDARSADGGIFWSGNWVLTVTFFTMVVLVRKLATRIASKRLLWDSTPRDVEEHSGHAGCEGNTEQTTDKSHNRALNLSSDLLVKFCGKKWVLAV